MTIFDDVLIGTLANRKGHKARYIENAIYRELRTREEAHYRGKRIAAAAAKKADAAAKKVQAAARDAARPQWLRQARAWLDLAAGVSIAAIFVIPMLGYVFSCIRHVIT